VEETPKMIQQVFALIVKGDNGCAGQGKLEASKTSIRVRIDEQCGKHKPLESIV